MRVNPNRMELLKLKRRGDMARRGHKLLKDKLDELMKAFLSRIGENRKLRADVERALGESFGLLAIARAEGGGTVLAQALMSGAPADLLTTTQQPVMSVRVPVFEVGGLPERAGYSYATTPAVLDGALDRLAVLAPRLVQLAEREKAIELLAAEIERTRRRVNALEYVLIPQISEAVRSVKMKLEEIERGNLTRLMKVKEMVASRSA